MDSLYDLAEGIRKCTACPLWKGRTLAVPGEGSSSAKIMVIAEAPGAEEDRQGLPFVGRSGKFLDKLLVPVGLSRDKIFLTGAVKCRPPQNRNPTAKELEVCRRLWLDPQIKLVQPDLIVLMGKIALKSVLNKNKWDGLHGRVLMLDTGKYFITYHPSAGMRFPAIKKKMEEDFKKLKTIVGSL